MKCVKKTVRHYWKYQYESWTQPVLTSDSTVVDEGIIETSAYVSQGGSEPYKALDGVKSGSREHCWRPNSGRQGWWKVKFPYKILITGLTHYNVIVSDYSSEIEGRFYTSSEMTTPIGDAISTPNTDWYATPITGIPAQGVLTDTIYFDKTYGSNYSGIGELEITAQKQVVVESTESDYDFYTDEEITLLLSETTRHYWKYVNTPLQQPALTSDGELGGSSFAVYASYYQGGHPAYYMLDGNSGTYYSNYPHDGGNYYTLYNPKPFKIDTLVFVFEANKGYSEFSNATIEGSIDGVDWDSLDKSWNSNGTMTINDNNTYYKYYRIYQNPYWSAYSCTITATEQTIVEGTADDYDYYTDDAAYYGIN